MSKNKPPKKKVVTTGSKKSNSGTTTVKKKRLSPTVSQGQRSKSSKATSQEFIFKKENYILMAAGFGIILLGLVLMIGGAMPDENTWDPDLIYGFRNTVLAPFLILVGLSVEIYAIFKK